jgi:6-phosphogluconate dehydrogenase
MKDAIEDWRERGIVRRLWRRDKSIWTSADEDKWLGWLDSVDLSLKQVPDYHAFAQDVKRAHVIDLLDPTFAALAPGLGNLPRTGGRANGDARAGQGYIHAGPSGAGHFVKMVHNGIEYGLMQAYEEGYDNLKNASPSLEALPEAQRFDLNIADIAEVWRRGSVITSWLLDLTASALAEDAALAAYSGVVQGSGECRWTIHAAIDERVSAEVLSAALYGRFRSLREHTFAEKILSAMRKGFGGHVQPKAGRS